METNAEYELIESHKLYHTSDYSIPKAVQFGGLTIILVVLATTTTTCNVDAFLALLGGGSWLAIGLVAWEFRWEHADVILQLAFSIFYVVGFVLWLNVLHPALFVPIPHIAYPAFALYLCISEFELWMGYSRRNKLRKKGLAIVLDRTTSIGNQYSPQVLFKKFRDEFGKIDGYTRRKDNQGKTVSWGFRWDSSNLEVYFLPSVKKLSQIGCVSGIPRTRKRLQFVAKSMLHSKVVDELRHMLLMEIDEKKLDSLDEIINYLTLAPLITGIVLFWSVGIGTTFRFYTAILVLVVWGSYKSARIKGAIDLRIGAIMALYTFLLYVLISIPLVLIADLAVGVIETSMSEPEGLVDLDSLRLLCTGVPLLLNMAFFAQWRGLYRSSGLKSWRYIQSGEVQQLIDKEVIARGTLEHDGTTKEYELIRFKRLESKQTAYEEAAIYLANLSRYTFIFLALSLGLVVISTSGILDVTVIMPWSLIVLPLSVYFLVLIHNRLGREMTKKAGVSLRILASFSNQDSSSGSDNEVDDTHAEGVNGAGKDQER